MTTSTADGRPTAGPVPPTAAEDRWSRVLRILAPGMASVAMYMGAPIHRTLWAYLLTERFRTEPQRAASTPNPRSPR